MEFCVGEIEAARSLVGHDPLFDLGNGQALAGRAALMQAEIAVGVVFALFLEYPDFVLAKKHDPALAILDFRRFTNELLSHTYRSLPLVRSRVACSLSVSRMGIIHHR